MKTCLASKVIRSDFGYECHYYPGEYRFMWASHNALQISCSAEDGIDLVANTPHLEWGMESFKKLLLLVESVHRQLVLDVKIMNGIWLNEEFWPLNWLENGKPGRS